jgi:hypothetical protein
MPRMGKIKKMHAEFLQNLHVSEIVDDPWATNLVPRLYAISQFAHFFLPTSTRTLLPALKSKTCN